LRRYLLDTSTALVALVEPERLSSEATRAVQRGANVLSAVSYWEIVTKTRKGTLNIGDPRVWWSRALEYYAAEILPLRPEHVAEAFELPTFHKDPFDRMLIAQAIAEDLSLVTTDAIFERYRSKRFRPVL
jgi:PIN domain nuclease of toxin-antitoxin system